MSIQSTERYKDDEESIRSAFYGMQSGIWTSEPGIIQSALAADGTTTVILSTQAWVTNPDSTKKLVTITPLIYCPVKFFGGGGLFMTHPIAQGDDCLVVFARRCIDAWWQNGGVNPPLENRLHDIHDGFCIPGFFSKPRALSNVSMNSIQIRTTSDVIANVTDTQIDFYKKLVVHADIEATGDVTALSGGSGFVKLGEHLHSDSGGTGDSGPPVGGT